jgi:hypothetical protein
MVLKVGYRLVEDLVSGCDYHNFQKTFDTKYGLISSWRVID